MNEQLIDFKATPVPMPAVWGAVISMMLGVFALATAEFLPPSVFMVGRAVLVAAPLFMALAVKPGTRAPQLNELVRQEGNAMLAGEIGSAVDYTTARGNRTVHHSLKT